MEEYLRRQMEYFASAREAKLPTPEDLILLSRHDVIVRHYLESWRGGVMTWEQTLIAIVLSLSERMQMLLGENLKALREDDGNPFTTRR